MLEDKLEVTAQHTVKTGPGKELHLYVSQTVQRKLSEYDHEEGPSQ